MAGLSPFTAMTNIFVTVFSESQGIWIVFSEFSETFRKNSTKHVKSCLTDLNYLDCVSHICAPPVACTV